MKKILPSRRFGATAVLTAVTFAGAGLAMAPTASASTAVATSASASTSGTVTPDGSMAGCQTVLDNFGELTTKTNLICAVTVTTAVFNASHAYTVCVYSMSGVGVNSRVALTACSFAAFG